MCASEVDEVPESYKVGVSAKTLFRFRVVSEVLAEMARGSTRGFAVKSAALRSHVQLDGTPCRVQPRTIYRWLAEYNRAGLDALAPKERPHTEDSVILSRDIIAFLVKEKAADPRASIPEVIRRARELGIVGSKEKVDRTTLWRAASRIGLPTRMRASKHEGDMQRYSYPFRMTMVLCDGKHFRAGVNRLKRVALFFLDDCTRKGLFVVVGTSESTELFLRGLHGLIQRHGLMNILYLDKGPGFCSNDTARVVGQLKTLLIMGRTAYPEGHGKVERFHQTTDGGVLRSLDGAVDVDPSPAALELRLQHYLDQYNQRPHESLDKKIKETPQGRWESDSRDLRFPASESDLRESFVITAERKVSNDHIIQFGGVDYQAPRGLGRQKVLVHRQILSGELSVPHGGKMKRLHPVDLAANARARRGKGETEPANDDVATPKTAATLAFERDHAPIVGDDGGFSEKE